MMPNLQKSSRRRGAAAVELAFVAPILLLMLFVLIEASRLVMVQHAITNIARESARQATLATTQQPKDVEDFVRDQLSSVVYSAADATKVKVNITPTSFTNIAADTPITVRVSVNFSDVTWLPGSWFIDNLEMNAQSSKARE
jgi:Flp pilus assembly protein TadG